jgi:Tol biopolymer transport system component
VVRLGVVLASILALSLPGSGGADANEPARLSFSLGVAGSGLCLADASGGEGVRLTPPRVFDDSQSWSPDGRKLAFHRTSEVGTGRSSQAIYVQEEGGRIEQIAEGTSFGWSFAGVSHPDWSPDGQRIAFDVWGGYRGTISSGISTARPDGSERRSLVSDLWRWVSDPAWSPSGDSIVFEWGSDLYLIDPSGGDGARLLVRDGFDPDWSPDGRSIVFSRRVGGLNYSDLVIIGADGGGQHRLTDERGEEEHPAWSPDGGWIAFEKRPHCGPTCGGSLDGTDIAVIRPDATDEHVLRGSSFAELTPAWRPPAPALPGRQRPCVIRGSRGPNTIRGSGLGDLIASGRGRDVIYGRGGNDLIDSGRGRDRVFGGSGTDASFLSGYDRFRSIETIYPPR